MFNSEDYEEFVDEMWFAPAGPEYAAIALGGEIGEVLNEVKKEIRDKKDISDSILLELGDSLYYLTRLSHEYGYSLGDIAKANIAKLKAKQLETGRPK